MMKRLLIISCIAGLAASGAHAGQSQSDDLDKFLKKNNIMNHVQRAGSNVHNAASALVNNAMVFLGVDYRYGGASADTGFDCSGFVQEVFKNTVGRVLPRSAAQQAAAAQTIQKEELRPGDLVFFNTMRRAFSHVGIYIGDGKFVHSPSTGSTVRVDSMSAEYWQNRFNGARRVIDADAQTVVSDLQKNITPVKAN